MSLTPAQWAAVIMLGCHLFIIGVALFEAVRQHEFRSGAEGARPWRNLRGAPLQIASRVWRGLLALVIALVTVCALAVAFGVGAWVVLYWL